MSTIFENLRNARNRRGLKRSEVAEKLSCAVVSLTSWESGKVMPSLGVLDMLCDIYRIPPLSSLEKEYGYFDLVEISNESVDQHLYAEQIALNLPHSMLYELCDMEAIRQETERSRATEVFRRGSQILDPFGRQMNGDAIDAIKKDYDESRKAGKDIPFAYHTLTPENKRVLPSMLLGLFPAKGNTQNFADNMDGAVALVRLGTERKKLERKGQTRLGYIDRANNARSRFVGNLSH